jgi:hypothetical protein
MFGTEGNWKYLPNYSNKQIIYSCEGSTLLLVDKDLVNLSHFDHNNQMNKVISDHIKWLSVYHACYIEIKM